ncbi:unnamed protein product [Schistocephalus solidus]|uniref:Protein kinase domain-containing protein n=1 Tax=Schistocephalus solidus TaxID=70667 RepID=A0A183T9A2_SCHSO|nr:unnamed protein product [Schistocephalus solidus]
MLESVSASRHERLYIPPRPQPDEWSSTEFWSAFLLLYELCIAGSSFDDSDAEISSADEETSIMAMVSNAAANKSSSTPTTEEEPTVPKALSSWAICSRNPLIYLNSLLKIIRRLTSDIPTDARTLLGGASDV